LWRKPGELQNHWTTPVYKDGYLYGLFKNGPGLRCIEMATGKEMWSKGGFAWQGATTLVGEHVLVQNERGEIALVKATPNGYEESARAQPMGGKCWTMATISNGRIFARSTTEAVCLDVSPNRVAANR
jgi:outer membrane protein assembly factor BamB